MISSIIVRSLVIRSDAKVLMYAFISTRTVSCFNIVTDYTSSAHTVKKCVIQPVFCSCPFRNQIDYSNIQLHGKTAAIETIKAVSCVNLKCNA